MISSSEMLTKGSYYLCTFHYILYISVDCKEVSGEITDNRFWWSLCLVSVCKQHTTQES